MSYLVCMLRRAACVSFAILLSACALAQSAETTGWPTYGNDHGGSRYSSAAQINRSNVNELKVAWTYDTGANDKPTA